MVVQICGENPEEMAIASRKISEHCDDIDINFGCPQDVAKRGHYGSYLQDEWDLVGNIISICSNASKVPLFCKIRVFESIQKSVEYAKMMEASGAKLLAVHGRIREQRGLNTGLALSIPVIANGNLLCYKNIFDCYEATNCDRVMSAEIHLYNPLLFSQTENESSHIKGKH